MLPHLKKNPLWSANERKLEKMMKVMGVCASQCVCVSQCVHFPHKSSFYRILNDVGFSKHVVKILRLRLDFQCQTWWLTTFWSWLKVWHNQHFAPASFPSVQSFGGTLKLCCSCIFWGEFPTNLSFGVTLCVFSSSVFSSNIKDQLLTMVDLTSHNWFNDHK